MAAASQLTLNLGLRQDATLDNFYPGPNQLVLQAIEWILAARQGSLYLYGESGSGKSHLLQGACHRIQDLGLPSMYLPLGQLLSLGPELLYQLEDLTLLAIDELERVAGEPAWEAALFQLSNAVRDRGGCLLWAAAEAPQLLEIRLPDLRSRLTWGGCYALSPLTDDDKLALLQQRAKALGLPLAPEVGRYLLRRAPRDLPSLLQLLTELDQLSLRLKRRLTIPLVRQLLGSRPSG